MAMIKKKLQAFLSFLLNDVSDKFDAIALKSIVDKLFIITEKIIIHFPKFLPFYINYYQDIIDQEIKLANITSKSLILHVGCGSIPASSMLLAQKTNASVVGIDRDAHAIKKAKMCIKTLHLSDKITVKKKDATKINLSSFDVILISQGIMPKQLFLQQLSKKISNNQLVILRSFSQHQSLDDHDNFLKDYYFIKDIFCHTTHGSTTSVILQKKK